MQSIPYIDIERRDFHTPERAQAHLEAVTREREEREAYAKEHGHPIMPSATVTEGVVGSVYFKMKFKDIDAYSIMALHHEENVFVDVQHLMQGRKVLPKHNGGEEANGLLDGLFD